MSSPTQTILLLDLPTFPKGTVALSLYAVAAAFGDQVNLKVLDLNHQHLVEALKGQAPDLIGMKVSAQNHHLALEYVQAIRENWFGIPVLWGGEFPTLEPALCLQTADSIVCGRFEPVAHELVRDLQEGQLKPQYLGSTGDFSNERLPRLDLIPAGNHHYRFMGLPMESSRGCTYKCTFCMVHQMQPGYVLKPLSMLKEELHAHRGEFLNLIDYNFGLAPDHVIQISEAIQDSQVLGWMGEMCLESLDDDAVLEALAKSRCRMVYCGLEAIDEASLKAVNKARTNQVANYERIIRKVQSYGIQIAGGVILGLPGSMGDNMVALRKFFERMGIAYAKLTFLTYNPGTKVRESMRRTGQYLSESPADQDGNHLSYLPKNMNKVQIHQDAEDFILKFYSLPAIIRRAFSFRTDFWGKLEMVLFNLCYRDAYLQWIEQGIFHDPEAFDRLLRSPLKKSWVLQKSESLLHWVRRKRFRNGENRPSPKSGSTASSFQLPNTANI